MIRRWGQDAPRTRVVRPETCHHPSPPVRREVLAALPERLADEPAPAGDRPPVLLVPGLGRGAAGYGEHWLEHVAARGFPAYAMSPRGQGGSASAGRADLRGYVHDVVQVAAGLPRRAVLVGHGAGATVVALAMASYPARAGVLLAPVFPGLGQAVTYLLRGGKAPGRVWWQLARGMTGQRPVGDPPMLVLGSPDDRMVPKAALERVARRYRGAPLLFPGMGHDLMLDPRWREPVDAICDWLTQLR